MEQGLFPTLAPGIFEHSGSRREEAGNKGRKERKEGGVEYTPKEGWWSQS